MASGNRLLEDIKEHNYINYPIKNELLESQTDYIKNTYFTLLAVVLQQGGEVKSGQRSLFQRLLIGAAAEHDMQDHIRRALEFDVETYMDFMSQLKELDEMSLKYRFLVDAVVLACCDVPTEEQLELLALFMGSLELSKDDVEYISDLCRSILEQDAALYWQTADKCIAGFDINTLSPYTSGYIYSQNYISVTDTAVRVYYSDKTALDPDDVFKEESIYQSVVKVSGCVIDMSKRPLEFDNNKQVVFENCRFENGLRSMFFTRTKEVVFRNCEFSDYKTIAVVEDSVGEASFISCSFYNCYNYYSRNTDDWKRFGCVIHTFNEAAANGINLLEDCRFDNCGGANMHNFFTSAFISDCRCEVKACEFDHCWHYNNIRHLMYEDTNTAKLIRNLVPTNGIFKKNTDSGANNSEESRIELNNIKVKLSREWIDADNPWRTMFIPGTVNNGNKIVDSAKLA